MRNYLIWGILLLVVGGFLVVLGFKERGLAAASSQEPEEVSLKDLIARGPEGNPNLILKDFVLRRNFVYRSKDGRWDGAWVPVVPREAAGPNQAGGDAARIDALIFTIEAHSEAELYQRLAQPRLRVLVTNHLFSLGSQEKNLLQQSYPGTDFSRCLILQEGREPAGTLKLSLLLGGGSLAALAGLGLLGFALVDWQRQRPVLRRRRQRRADEDEEEAPRRRARRRAEEDEEDEEAPRRRVRRRARPEEEEAE